LWAWCTKYVLGLEDVKHESDLAYGAGYRYIRQEFETAINFLSQKGYGIIFISHEQTTEVEQKNKKLAVTDSTLPTTAKKAIYPLVDYILYFTEDTNGHRYIQTKGTENLIAGDRSGKLPEKIEMCSETLIKTVKENLQEIAKKQKTINEGSKNANMGRADAGASTTGELQRKSKDSKAGHDKKPAPNRANVRVDQSGNQVKL
jgi:hypothetical protein